jgi:hypothetical protein
MIGCSPWTTPPIWRRTAANSARGVLSIAEGDQHSNEKPEDYQMRFAEELQRIAETRLIFCLAAEPGAF